MGDDEPALKHALAGRNVQRHLALRYCPQCGTAKKVQYRQRWANIVVANPSGYSSGWPDSVAPTLSVPLSEASFCASFAGDGFVVSARLPAGGTPRTRRIGCFSEGIERATLHIDGDVLWTTMRLGATPKTKPIITEPGELANDEDKGVLHLTQGNPTLTHNLNLTAISVRPHMKLDKMSILDSWIVCYFNMF